MDRDPIRSTASDAQLLRASRRNADAFREIYDRHAAHVYRVLARRTGDRDAALDLTAETFAAAWLARHRFRDHAGGSAAPWLFGIARNVLVRSVRRRELERRARERLGIELGGGERGPAVDETWVDGLDEELEYALSTLNTAERQTLELRVVDDLEYDEIAARLGISPGAARVRVFRALARLRRELASRPREVPNEH